MKRPMYVITGISRLTGDREKISREMSREEAEERLQLEKARRKDRRRPAYTRLRVDRVEPVQLTLNFSEHEE